MIRKLRRRFIRIAMLSVALVLVVLILSVNLINYLSTVRSLDRTLDMICDNRGAMPEFDGRGPQNGRPDPGFNPETPFATRYFTVELDDSGTVLGSDLRHIAAVTEEELDDYAARALKKGEGSSFVSPYRCRIIRQEDGTVMAVFLDSRRELGSARTFALVSLLALVGCLALVYLLILLLSKRAIDPVVQSIEKQKQFITDASHELKTPLTVIITSLRVLEMETGKQKWIDKAQSQAANMTDLINQLVTLSRMDEERPALNVGDFCVSDAVRETVESFADVAEAKGLSLTWDIEPDVTLRGDQLAVRQLASVLADNAVKYCAEGGDIRFTLRATARGAELLARNSCEAMDPAELDRLFDRFYRVDKSRNKKTGGFGVGLAIARGVAEAHGGSIRARCPDGHTIEFTAELRNMKG